VIPTASGLSALANEAGVRGALIADDKGRVISCEKLSGGQEDVLAAFANEVTKASGDALTTVSQGAVTMWTIVAAQGQILLFKRDPFCVVILADTGVRPAILEIRARQALIDLGAG
jgi:predicted regulator of Ras-like GTPase activity (Roadblock/LC7/MglB family)